MYGENSSFRLYVSKPKHNTFYFSNFKILLYNYIILYKKKYYYQNKNHKIEKKMEQFRLFNCLFKKKKVYHKHRDLLYTLGKWIPHNWKPLV